MDTSASPPRRWYVVVGQAILNAADQYQEYERHFRAPVADYGTSGRPGA